MNILIAHIAVPTLTTLAMMFAKTQKQVRTIAAGGMTIQLILVSRLVVSLHARASRR